MIAPDDLASILRANGFLRIERPPSLWAVDSDHEPFIAMLGELIALALGPAMASGHDVTAVTLNVSNVVVEDGERPPPGDYVAVTLRSPGPWRADDAWHAGDGPTTGALCNVAPRADAAGAVFAYSRALGDGGSATVLLRRA